MQKRLVASEGCVRDGIGNKCACCERDWRAEKEINEQV